MAGLITGSLGRFCGANLLVEGSIGGGTWSGALPLANILANALADSPRHIGAPARQLTPATLANNIIEITLPKQRALGLIAVVFHTMSLAAKFRVTIAGPGETLADPVYQSEWKRVFPRQRRSMDMGWTEPGWWTGQPSQADIDLYPRHAILALDERIVAKQIRLEFDDRTNAVGYFDIGGLWLAYGWSPQFNFDRGRRQGLKFRAQVEEGPSGRLFGDRRRPRRTIAVTWSGLTKDEAWRLYDDCVRTAGVGQVLFVPDAGALTSLPREVWPATIEAPAEPTFTHERQHSTSITLKEVIA